MRMAMAIVAIIIAVVVFLLLFLLLPLLLVLRVRVVLRFLLRRILPSFVFSPFSFMPRTLLRPFIEPRAPVKGLAMNSGCASAL